MEGNDSSAVSSTSLVRELLPIAYSTLTKRAFVRGVNFAFGFFGDVVALNVKPIGTTVVCDVRYPSMF